MEGISRLVSESLARHGFDRPLDYRRLHWSRWFRCESLHSLLFVPSKPGVFALAEEIMSFDSAPNSESQVGATESQVGATSGPDSNVEERRFSAASSELEIKAALAAAVNKKEEKTHRRMLAVAQFFESDDMAFSLDRMLVQVNPMRARLNSGRYFIRYVAIADESQRRSIATALNQWIANSGEKISGIGAHFASSLELTPVTAGIGTAHVATGASPVTPARSAAAPSAAQTAIHLDSGAATNIHCPSPLPSGF